MAMDERESAIDALLAYQREQLTTLEAERDDVDQQLHAARERLDAAREKLVVARALVQARKGGATLHERPMRERREPCATASVTKRNETEEMRGELQPIGVLYSTLQKRYEAPRQAFTGTSSSGMAILTHDLAPNIDIGGRVIILYHFDRNGTNWREFVQPPRRPRGAGRVGVLATRSPHRPSPIGLSMGIVTSISDCRRKVYMDGLDVLDETPILSLRAYNAAADAHTSTCGGWLEGTIRPLHYDEAPQPAMRDVVVRPLAEEKLRFIALVERSTSGGDVRQLVVHSLQRGLGRKGVLPVGSFRVLYDDADGKLVVRDVVSGMRDAVCAAEQDTDPEAKLHAEFKTRFPLPE